MLCNLWCRLGFFLQRGNAAILGNCYLASGNPPEKGGKGVLGLAQEKPDQQDTGATSTDEVSPERIAAACGSPLNLCPKPV